MALQSYKAKAPGSLMLFGEYAVLYGLNGIVSAINKHIEVTISTNTTNKLTINSALSGIYEESMAKISIQPPYTFITAVITFYQKYLTTGLNITVQSTIDANLGLGSSAAILIATLAALTALLQLKLTKLKLFETAKKIMLTVQQVGSGADLAASIYGGIINFSNDPLVIKPLTNYPPITIIYCGYKKKTPEVIKLVSQNVPPKILTTTIAQINNCALATITAFAEQDWHKLGEIAKSQQQLMRILTVSDPTSEQIIALLESKHQIYGAKISGSGLGDCIIGFGSQVVKIDCQAIPKALQLAITIEPNGLMIQELN